MKNILIIFLLASTICFGQKEYKTKSGMVYRVGDTLKLGQPINISSGPIIATTGEWATVFTLKNERLRNMNFINKAALITKINLENRAKLFFKLYGKQFYVLIDEALTNGEVSFFIENMPKNSSDDKYDKLMKLKKLLDIGALTKVEYEAEKKKILNSN